MSPTFLKLLCYPCLSDISSLPFPSGGSFLASAGFLATSGALCHSLLALSDFHLNHLMNWKIPENCLIILLQPDREMLSSKCKGIVLPTLFEETGIYS